MIPVIFTIHLGPLKLLEPKIFSAPPFGLCRAWELDLLLALGGFLSKAVLSGLDSRMQCGLWACSIFIACEIKCKFISRLKKSPYFIFHPRLLLGLLQLPLATHFLFPQIHHDLSCTVFAVPLPGMSPKGQLGCPLPGEHQWE